MGICGGQQLMNVVYGGSLIQDINKEVDTNIKHEQPNPRNQTSHTVQYDWSDFLLSLIHI